MKDIRQNISFYIIINYQNEDHELLVSFSSTVKELKKIIITYFKLNQSIFDIYYNNNKLNNDDSRPLSLLFEKDKKPHLFILDSKSNIIQKSKQETSLTLYTNIATSKMNEIITKFYEYKQLENNCEIKNNIKGIYIINFPKASLCADFQEFYANFLRIDEESKLPSPKKTKTTIEPRSKLILPKIYNNYNKNKGIENDNKYDGFNDRKKALNKVILKNSKSDYISEKNIRSGKYRMHNSGKNANNKKSGNSMRAKFNNYKGEYRHPYMNEEEKYYRDKYLDKKNWINKNGFLPSIKKRNNNFISNYVTATPSESPLLFHFRDVRKDKWINPKGFH